MKNCKLVQFMDMMSQGNTGGITENGPYELNFTKEVIYGNNFK